MRFIEDIELDANLFRLTYRSKTTGDYPGYYHCHRGIELFLIHDGIGHVVVNQRIHEFRPNLLFCYRPFQLHKVHADPTPVQPFTRSVITFEPAAFEAYVTPFPQLHQLFLQMWKDEQGLQAVLLGANFAYVDNLLAHYAERLDAAAERDRQSLFALFLLQLLEYLLPFRKREEPASAGATNRNPSYSEQILTWLENRYAEPFHLEMLAGELHLSKHYVSRVFRRETGSSITEYLTARRLRQACRLLATTKHSVQAIGQQVGFDNFSHFCQQFRKGIGISPYQFRKASGR